MDLTTLDWDPDLLAAMGIPAVMLPQVVPSIGRLGVGVGSLAGVPISGILGDQQAALFGQGCHAAGQAKNTYGTGCFLLLHTGQQIVPSRHGLLTTVACQQKGKAPTYALEGSVAMAGATVQWLRDEIGLIADSADVETLARTVEDNGDVYLVPAFSGLFAPHWRADARGAVVGLTRYTNRGHFARAALESTAFQTAEVLEAMRADSGVELSELRVDGGMVVNDLLMQFQADLLGVPVVRPLVEETTALGAAYAAGLAEDLIGRFRGEARDDGALGPGAHGWRELRLISAELVRADRRALKWQEGGRWTPSMTADDRTRLTTRWNQAVQRTLDWV